MYSNFDDDQCSDFDGMEYSDHQDCNFNTDYIEHWTDECNDYAIDYDYQRYPLDVEVGDEVPVSYCEKGLTVVSAPFDQPNRLIIHFDTRGQGCTIAINS